MTYDTNERLTTTTETHFSNETSTARTTNSNNITLDKALVDEFKTYQANIGHNTILMAHKAYQIRSQYLHFDGKKYVSDFNAWWDSYDLNKVFGKHSNFTKWAAAGKAMECAKIHDYDERLPTTLTALYEVSLLSSEELKLCLQDRYTRSTLTDEPKGRKQPQPLIHPDVTAGEIRNWRKKWRNPKSRTVEKRRLQFASIKVHGSLFDFDDKGKHVGILTPDILREIDATLTKALSAYGDSILIDTKFEALLEGHVKRQEKAEIKAQRNAEKKRTRTKSSSAHSRLAFEAIL